MSETPATAFIGHRQLVAAIVALTTGEDDFAHPYFRELGYALNVIEQPMTDCAGRRFEADVHLVNNIVNTSLLAECKTGKPTLRDQQLECYLNIDGPSVVEQGQLTLANPRSHSVDAIFFATSSTADAISATVSKIKTQGESLAPGFAVIEVTDDQLIFKIGALTHGDLESSLTDGWKVQVWKLPLERVPFTNQSPQWELAHFVCQALARFFVIGREKFTVDDICIESNPWWPYLGSNQLPIKRRVRQLLSQIRRTALKGWLETSPPGAAATSEWRFTKAPSRRGNVISAMQLRSEKYVALLQGDKQPRPEDFDDVEQLSFQSLRDL